MIIYKIIDGLEWAAFQKNGIFSGSVVDLADGFIHFSTGAQVGETARRHFCGRTGLVLLAIDADALGEGLRYEPSRGGALFPHFYGMLSIRHVVWDRALASDPNGIPVIGDLPADQS